MVFSGVVNISVDKILVVMTSVETNTASLEFSRKFLRFTPHTFALTQINVGEGETHGSVSRLID